MNPPYTALVLMHFDTDGRDHPLMQRGYTAGKQLDPGSRHYLFAKLVQPSTRATSAPVATIPLEGDLRKDYNAILGKFEDLSNKFYGKGGFIERPESYTEERQADITDRINAIGVMIYGLFNATENPVRIWLDRVLNRPQREQPLTIVTNDFNIPWFWLKNTMGRPALCEACSLGMLQLSASGRGRTGHRPAAMKNYDAAFIHGSPAQEMQFLEEELTDIAASLKPRGSESRVRGSDFVFETHQFRSRAEIQQILSNEERSMLDRFRIVHFSGHFRGSHDGLSEGRYETLDIDGTPQVIWQLEPMLNNALLVLDGCGSAKGLTAWAEVEGLTSKLINAFGVHSCVVTVLPHKHDPIASKVFWKAFYSDLLVGVKSPGHALMTARKKLRRHFEEIGSNNPMWANFQLIGNPAVPLLTSDDEDEDNE